MLSTPPHHQYAPTFTSLPSSAGVMSHTSHLQSHGLSTPDMDTLSNASGYALHYLHQTGSTHHALQSSKSTMKNRHHPYNNGNYTSNGTSRSGTSEARNGSSTASSGPVRRRISRACDQCNQLRTKCDGKLPCAHCVDFGLSCEYVRERKKRGKASRKDNQQQQVAAAGAAGIVQSPTGFSSEGLSPTTSIHSMNGRQSLNDLPRQPMSGSRSMSLGSTMVAGNESMNQLSNPRAGSLGDLSTITVGTPVMNGHHHYQHQLPAQNHHLSSDTPHSHVSHNDGMDNSSGLGLNCYDRLQDFQQAAANDAGPGLRLTEHLLQTRASLQRMSGSAASSHTGSVYGDAPFAMLSPQSHHGHPSGYSSIPRTCDTPLTGFMGNSPTAESPAWMSLPSPPTNYPQQYQSSHNLRYPVLRPLLSHIGSIMPTSLACDLLDLYFTSSSSAYMHPLSPYILGYVFRKRSILHPIHPRPCSPALLASVLWVAAQTSDAPHLTVPPAARTRTCQKLLELTVSLLKPLIHVPSSGDGVNGQANRGGMMINGVSLGGLGVAMPVQINGSEGGAVGAAGALDDVATYIHVASIVSASEYKAASLRWWHAAWSLARELKLNRELPPSPSGDSTNDTDADGVADLDLETVDQQSPHGSRHAPSSHRGPAAGHGGIGEEEREERRRIWWLLYIVDRHLALCYNRPLALLDIECDGLLLPIDETVWQFSETFTGSSPINTLARHRRRDPSFECTDHSIFGYFLPLMTILGEIVDFNHARNHPRLGVGFRNSEEWDSRASEITQQLETYGRSLQDFAARNLSNTSEGDANSNQNNNEDVPSSRGKRMTDSEIQTRIVVAYGTHVMHVLHILLTGKWDPITLLDDNDLWISSQSFISSTGHAVSAAEAISDILEYDPDLSFMPFFFGIYLLQGSFLLLLIADKLQGEASPSVVKACETIVRAHEACVVTLNTEYQRNFRKVMRSALAQVRGRIPEDTGEQQLRRREVLALYRWTGDGTGLAL